MDDKVEQMKTQGNNTNNLVTESDQPNNTKGFNSTKKSGFGNKKIISRWRNFYGYE